MTSECRKLQRVESAVRAVKGRRYEVGEGEIGIRMKGLRRDLVVHNWGL